jgi:hypothetical protein
MAFWNFGGLAYVRYSVLKVGAGYGYIPGFTTETYGYYAGTGSPLLVAGLTIPIRLADRVNLLVDAKNVFTLRLASFYNPSVRLGLAYRMTRPKQAVRPERPAPIQLRKADEQVANAPLRSGPKPSFPPRLETQLAFEEAGRRNQALDAGEHAFILVTLVNSGKGRADSVRVRTEAISTIEGVSIGADAIVPAIAPKETAHVKVRLEASEDVPDQEIRFRVSVIEPVFGADALPAVVTIAARSIEPPELAVHDNAITDNESESEWAQGNGNGQLEINEQVEVTTIVQNRGIGTAFGVHLTVTPTDENVLYQSPQSQLDLGDIPAGEWRTLKYPVFVNARFRDDTVRLTLSMVEQRPKFNRSALVKIPMNTKIQAPTEVAVQPKARPGVPTPASPPSLTDSLLVDIPRGAANPDAFAVVVGVSKYRSVAAKRLRRGTVRGRVADCRSQRALVRCPVVSTRAPQCFFNDVAWLDVSTKEVGCRLCNRPEAVSA